MRGHRIAWAAAAALVLIVPMCGDRCSGPVPAAAVPDFELLDVNPNSSSYRTSVSPRDHLGHVSVWYFGHAT